MAIKDLLNSWEQIENSEKSYQNNNNYSYPRLSEFVEILDKKKYTKKYQQIRLLGPIISIHNHVVRAKKKDGTEYIYYQPCLNFNPETQMMEDNNCPFCQIGSQLDVKYYENAIIREIEEKGPDTDAERTDYEKKGQDFGGTKFFLKEGKNKGAWTPVRVVEIPRSLVQKIRNIEGLNFYKNPDTGEREKASISDLTYGVDLLIMYNPDSKEPAAMYDLQRDPEGGKTPISLEYRKSLLLWNLNCLPAIDKEKVKEEFKRSCIRFIRDKVKNPEVLDLYIQEAMKASKPTIGESKPKKQIQTVGLDEDEVLDREVSPVQSLKSIEIDTPPFDTNEMDDFEDLD